ncbi:MAG: response regulator [Bryobacterales bacterium]|nr:response regulator [Bryobacterales bacterium]
MNSSLRILYLEDNKKDVELVEDVLAHAGIPCEVVQVEAKDEFLTHLDHPGFDLILSDYSLPGFDGASALAAAREKCPHKPFVFLTGSLGEDAAIDALTRGASDYVFKDKIGRLAPAVRRVLREAKSREALQRMEEQLRQAQKMEVVGQLAGGIAHDFNNLLTIILGHSELLLRKTTSEDPLLRLGLEQIRTAGERGALITRRLLAFSRKQALQPATFNLNEILLGMEGMLRTLAAGQIELEISAATLPAFVTADAGQMQQVILNLAVNARDAMPKGGKLAVAIDNVDIASGSRSISGFSGPAVVLTVRDSGIGMDRATLARIFEPFFTTKEPEKGTGLGLAVVHGIVKDSQGHVDVSSKPGRGTTFQIYLPRAAAPEPAHPPQPMAKPVRRATEVILAVDDEPQILAVAAQVLRMEGYSVLEADNAQAALAIASAHLGPIHLLLTDVILPQMRGNELAAAFLRSRPGAAVLYISGNVADSVRSSTPGSTFLEKPFTPSQLVDKVREVMRINNTLRALVADDDADVRAMLKTMLAEVGFEVCEAANGRQAVEECRKRHFDVVMIDIVMPEQEGLVTIRQLRKELPDLKIIAMSGAFAGQFLHVAHMLGATAVLSKPFRPGVVLDILGNILGLPGEPATG